MSDTPFRSASAAKTATISVPRDSTTAWIGVSGRSALTAVPILIFAKWNYRRTQKTSLAFNYLQIRDG